MSDFTTPPNETIEQLAKVFNCNCEHCYGRQHNIAKTVSRMIIESRIDELQKYAPYIVVDGENKSKVERIMELRKEMETLC